MHTYKIDTICYTRHPNRIMPLNMIPYLYWHTHSNYPTIYSTISLYYPNLFTELNSMGLSDWSKIKIHFGGFLMINILAGNGVTNQISSTSNRIKNYRWHHRGRFSVILFCWCWMVIRTSWYSKCLTLYLSWPDVFVVTDALTCKIVN